MNEIRLLLVRKYYPRQTLGRFFVFSGITTKSVFECASLELPNLNNKQYVSCIPEGIYPCRKMISSTFGRIIAVDEVPGRDKIRIHQGNYISDILGCILPGQQHLFMDQDDLYDVNYSRATLKSMMQVLPDQFNIKIVSM